MKKFYKAVTIDLSRYKPNGPSLGAGLAKCAKKGHRPPTDQGACTRCGARLVNAESGGVTWEEAAG